MFTGIISAVGHVAKIEAQNGDWKVTIHTGQLDMSDVQLGDSIATNGMRLQDRLGGHLVSGHVDGVGEVKRITQDGRSWRYEIEAPLVLAKYIAAKGSICINGISLTVNQVNGCLFDVNIVPHTRQETTIKAFQEGTKMNLEVDLLARYLERMMSAPQVPTPSNITSQFLAENGFK